jgi:hypothetical protein
MVETIVDDGNGINANRQIDDEIGFNHVKNLHVIMLSKSYLVMTRVSRERKWNVLRFDNNQSTGCNMGNKTIPIEENRLTNGATSNQQNGLEVGLHL